MLSPPVLFFLCQKYPRRRQAKRHKPSGAGSKPLALKQIALSRRFRRIQSQMPPRPRRQHPPARGALDQPLLQKIRLDDFLQRIAALRQRRRKRFNPDRPARVMLGHQPQIAPYTLKLLNHSYPKLRGMGFIKRFFYLSRGLGFDM